MVCSVVNLTQDKKAGILKVEQPSQKGQLKQLGQLTPADTTTNDIEAKGIYPSKPHLYLLK